jgi:hypothetical protein
MDAISRARQAAGHDSAAYLLGFAVEDGIITDDQRLALLERWLSWGDRRLTAGCEQSREDAQRIRREQGRAAAGDLDSDETRALEAGR